MEKIPGEKLFPFFPPPSYDDWMKVASSELAGTNPIEKLGWKHADLSFLPIYTQQHIRGLNTSPAFVIGNSSQPRVWANLPLVIVADERMANETALEHLRNEAEGVLFRLTSEKTDFDRLLERISWEHCTVSFAGKGEVPPALTEFIRHRVDGSKISGAFFSEETQGYSPLINTHFKIFGIVITPSNAVDELANALVKGVSVIENGSAKGYPVGDIIRHIAFQLPIGPELLIEVAKLKAFAGLWYQVIRAYGVSDSTSYEHYVHGYSDKWINPRYQPHGNMLKSTIASIAGISGGCHAITIVPEETENQTMSRIARNVSHILLEESHLGKVNDPFAGAYALEVMINEISENAWKKFQTLIK